MLTNDLLTKAHDAVDDKAVLVIVVTDTGLNAFGEHFQVEQVIGQLQVFIHNMISEVADPPEYVEEAMQRHLDAVEAGEVYPPTEH